MADRAKELSWAAAILRAMLGAIFLYHGAQMLFGAFGGNGFDGTAERISGYLGFRPGTLFTIVFGGTVFLSGLFLFIGLFTRPASIPAAVASGLALFWNHWAEIVFKTPGEIFPYHLLLFAVAVAVYFTGPGAFSVDRKIARERADARGA